MSRSSRSGFMRLNVPARPLMQPSGIQPGRPDGDGGYPHLQVILFSEQHREEGPRMNDLADITELSDDSLADLASAPRAGL